MEVLLLLSSSSGVYAEKIKKNCQGSTLLDKHIQLLSFLHCQQMSIITLSVCLNMYNMQYNDKDYIFKFSIV